MKLQPDIDKEGSISDILKVGQEILVQVAKEPISTKGPRLTAEISFAGRFMVLIPFINRVSVSQKLSRAKNAPGSDSWCIASSPRTSGG